MQAIWSAVKRYLSGLMRRLKEGPTSQERSGGSGLGDRMESRIRAEQEKVNQLEAIEKRVKGLEGAIGSLREGIRRFHKELGRATEKQGEIRKIQNEIAGGLKETQKGIKRLARTIIEHESDLVEIEDLKEQHRVAAKTRRRTLLLGAVVGGVIGALISEIPILWMMSSLWMKIRDFLSFLA